MAGEVVMNRITQLQSELDCMEYGDNRTYSNPTKYARFCALKDEYKALAGRDWKPTPLKLEAI